MPRPVKSWAAPLAAFGAALAVYLLTAPPGLTWAHNGADGGDLVAAALVAGVPHPTGYPTFTLLARLFTRLPWHSPAWRVTLLSAVGGALAAAFVAATVQDLSTGATARRRLNAEPRDARPPSAAPPLVTSLAGLTAGLLLAFTPLLWSQSVIAEVYALQAGLVAALVWALARWQRSGNAAWAALAGLVFGLGLGNHLTMLWLLPLVVISWVAVDDEQGTPLWRVRAVASFGLALLLGLAVYVYLPAAAAGNPPVNWGDPQTVAGFWWLVSGQLYRSFAFAVPWPEAVARLPAWSGLLWRSFLPWGVALALGGLAVAFNRYRSMTVGALCSLLLGLVWAVGYNTTDSALTLLAGWVIVAVWIGLGLAELLRWLVARWPKPGRPLAVLLCAALLAAPLLLNWSGQDLGNDRRAEDFIVAVLDAVQPDAVVVTAGDRATFSLWYARYGLGRRPDVAPVSRDLWPLESYRATIGETHPQLAGPRPPAAWPSFLQAVAEQGRPIYLATSSSEAAALPSLGLDPQAPYRLELAVAGGSEDGWTVWKLQPK